ncbi:hypothetical protein EYB53_021410 [Candidatus Chloroploca sp. M-50]|uniref:Uncharacterized protein n=1 Tax=Candidatus Chloroploca mongolica TaxID=2528176 RepID=A0ABS4DFS3_9CHLR|nr:hypothetical protein [Candidatus Chloroploca mongolica]MBP1468283.1 hypothetical protein [Candidatus Chloroploca mongolica]
MSDRTLSVYESANWGSRLAGVALVRYDARGILLVNEVPVETTRKSGHFTVLHCVDGSTSVVLSSFLRLVPDARHQGEQSAALVEICG